MWQNNLFITQTKWFLHLRVNITIQLKEILSCNISVVWFYLVSNNGNHVENVMEILQSCLSCSNFTVLPASHGNTTLMFSFAAVFLPLQERYLSYILVTCYILFAKSVFFPLCCILLFQYTFFPTSAKNKYLLKYFRLLYKFTAFILHLNLCAN